MMIPATACLDNLSLHDALPICAQGIGSDLHLRCVAPHDDLAGGVAVGTAQRSLRADDLRYLCHARGLPVPGSQEPRRAPRSEEHTSELQSRLHLVCRLLLEKKK